MNVTPIEEDIFFLKKTVSDLTEQIELLSTLQDTSIQIISEFDFDKIVNLFLDLVKEIVNYKSCLLYLYNDDLNSYKMITSRNITEKDLQIYDLDNEIIQWAVKERRWTHILPKQINSKDSVFFTVLPVQGAKNNLGFLLMSSDPENDIFNQANMKRLSFVARQTGIALENQNLYSKLSQSTDYINNILESINNGIITIDMADRITQINMNATAMLGISSVDIVGFNYKEVLSENLVNIIDKIKQKALHKGFIFETMFDFFTSNDLNIPLGINASVLIDHSGNRIGVIFVFMDMLALKEIERLRQVDELKSEFVSNVSHELRTPLSVIKSYVEALREQVEPDDHDTRQKFLAVVDSEADRLSDLVSDLLDISKIESGRFEIDLAPVSLSDIVYQVSKNLENRSSIHKIIIDIPSNLPELLVDRDKIIQVFFNIIDNAIKFSPDGGKVSIKAMVKDKKVKCDISDQGIGIDENEIPHIFEKFYRVNNSDRYEISGTGLGLSIVKHIIESHNGTISVKSKRGQGSIFSVLLPLGSPESMEIKNE